MKKFMICLVTVMLFFAYADNSHAVLGIPDHVPAATLIVPFFEVGIDSAANPHDTLPVVTNICTSALTVHYEAWDRGGELTALSGGVWGNLSIASGETKSLSMRDLINSPATSAGTRTQLTDGAFYRGFVSFDVVTASTTSWPTNVSYPFSSLNCLIGQVYYTRLSQGSSNGLPLVAIEATPGGTSTFLRGFYQAGDDREEIDEDARYSAEQMTRGGAAGANPANAIQRIQSRLYLEPVNNGTSRVIVFAFKVGQTCIDCGPGTVSYAIRDGLGTVVGSGLVNLDRYVNIITVFGTTSGWLNLVNIPAEDWEVYAFSFNSASPGFNPALTWDAIFESFILP
jgi:hypothetical protein